MPSNILTGLATMFMPVTQPVTQVLAAVKGNDATRPQSVVANTPAPASAPSENTRHLQVLEQNLRCAQFDCDNAKAAVEISTLGFALCGLVAATGATLLTQAILFWPVGVLVMFAAGVAAYRMLPQYLHQRRTLSAACARRTTECARLTDFSEKVNQQIEADKRAHEAAQQAAAARHAEAQAKAQKDAQRAAAAEAKAMRRLLHPEKVGKTTFYDALERPERFPKSVPKRRPTPVTT